jgi:hypothetical protein
LSRAQQGWLLFVSQILNLKKCQKLESSKDSSFHMRNDIPYSKMKSSFLDNYL